MSRRPPRIFFGMAEVSGYYGGHAGLLRDLGYDVTFVHLGPNPFGYEHSAPSKLVRAVQIVATRRHSAGRLSNRAWKVLEGAARALLLVATLPRFETYVFGFGNSFLAGWDLPVLRIFGKRVVAVFNGSDARPPYIDGPHLLGGHDTLTTIAATRRVRGRLARFERWAHVVVAHPLYSQLLRRKSIQFLAVGQPVKVRSRRVRPGTGPLAVIHAPSNRAVKGTDLVRSAVATVRAQGIAIDYQELAGLPHDSVMAALECADVVIDQAYSDLPWSMFSAEAGSVGVPAIVGGYGWDEIKRLVDPAWVAPAFMCSPEGLAETLLELARNRDRLSAAGVEAYAFASRMNGVAAARRLAVLLEADPPADWQFDPRDVAYLWGCGAPTEVILDRIRDVTSVGGMRSLLLDDKPDLLREASMIAAGEGKQ